MSMIDGLFETITKNKSSKCHKNHKKKFLSPRHPESVTVAVLIIGITCLVVYQPIGPTPHFQLIQIRNFKVLNMVDCPDPLHEEFPQLCFVTLKKDNLSLYFLKTYQLLFIKGVSDPSHFALQYKDNCKIFQQEFKFYPNTNGVTIQWQANNVIIKDF